MERGFFAKVYDTVRKIPLGKVATYGQIARLVGKPLAARQVGWALHSNPTPYVTPCHRVVNREGKLSGAFAFGGLQAQRYLLENEGVTFVDEETVDLQKNLWEA